MTDYRDPPRGPDYREPTDPPGRTGVSNTSWGWIAGLAIVALVLVFAYGMSGDNSRVATDSAVPPATTTGQRTVPAPASPPASTPSEAPTQNRTVPAPAAPN